MQDIQVLFCPTSIPIEEVIFPILKVSPIGLKYEQLTRTKVPERRSDGVGRGGRRRRARVVVLMHVRSRCWSYLWIWKGGMVPSMSITIQRIYGGLDSFVTAELST